MNLNFILRKLMRKFIESDENLFNTDLEENKKYINKFNNPKDDYDRSYYQYKCTMFRLGKIKQILLEISGALLLLPYYFKLRNTNTSFINQYDAIFMTEGISLDTIPTSLKNEFPKIKKTSFGIKMIIDNEDAKFLKRNFKGNKFSYYFKLKMIMKLGMYSYLIKSYNPRAIISYTECSFTSSLLTKYCEEKGIENICIMHGERLFSLKLSFFRFSRYYVWDKHYIELFKELRAYEKQFILEIPKSLEKDILHNIKNYKYFITFYLQDESIESLYKIKKACEILKKNNKECSIRLHPRSYNHKAAINILSEFNIEDNEKISLQESLNNTEYVASAFSTVLYEAWYKNKKIIIDNYSQPEKYAKLKDLKYIMLKKEHNLLTDIISVYERDELNEGIN